MVKHMSAGRQIGLGLLGVVLGAIVGGAIGLLGGLAYTELAHTSGFEGYAGFVVVFWMLGGIVVGLIVGLIGGLRLSRRPPKP